MHIFRVQDRKAHSAVGFQVQEPKGFVRLECPDENCQSGTGRGGGSNGHGKTGQLSVFILVSGRSYRCNHFWTRLVPDASDIIPYLSKFSRHTFSIVIVSTKW